MNLFTRNNDLIDHQLEFVMAETLFHSSATDPDSPGVIHRYLDTGLELADKVNHQQQESILFRLLENLIAVISDPLHHPVFRRNCMNLLYQPIGKLKKLYRDKPESMHRLNAIRYELQLMSQYLN